MVWFLTRSALCIGAVAVAASGMSTERFATAFGRGAREVAADAGHACSASRACLRAGGAALSTAAGLAPDRGAMEADPDHPGPRWDGTAARRSPTRHVGALAPHVDRP